MGLLHSRFKQRRLREGKIVEAVMRYLILMLILAGCTSAEETYMPDGRKGYAINCSSHGIIVSGWSDCYAEAGNLCGQRGYDIVEKSTPPLVGTENKRSLVIACK